MERLFFNSCEGSNSLAQDLKNYMKLIGHEKLENKTAEIMVLNPKSVSTGLVVGFILTRLVYFRFISKIKMRLT